MQLRMACLDWYICKRKGNQQQLDHAHDVLQKFDDATNAAESPIKN